MKTSLYYRQKSRNEAAKKANKKEEPIIPILTEEYKTLICNQSYLGKKGYTIPKSILTPVDEAVLRKELFVKPIIAGVSYGPEEQPFLYFEKTPINYIFLDFTELRDMEIHVVPRSKQVNLLMYLL